MSENSLGGNRYFLLFIDNFSKMTWVYTLRNKSKAFEMFRKFHALVEKQTWKKLTELRNDRGGKFRHSEFLKYCEDLSIKREFTAPYTPQQNGAVERNNRIVVEMGRSLLKSRDPPIRFWGEAVSTAIYMINRAPTQAMHNRTPNKVWHGVKSTVSHLKVFGCTAFVLIPSQKHHKMDEKLDKCVFIGYSAEAKAYKLYNLITNKVITSRIT